MKLNNQNREQEITTIGVKAEGAAYHACHRGRMHLRLTRSPSFHH